MNGCKFFTNGFNIPSIIDCVSTLSNQATYVIFSISVSVSLSRNLFLSLCFSHILFSSPLSHSLCIYDCRFYYIYQAFLNILLFLDTSHETLIHKYISKNPSFSTWPDMNPATSMDTFNDWYICVHVFVSLYSISEKGFYM